MNINDRINFMVPLNSEIIHPLDEGDRQCFNIQIRLVPFKKKKKPMCPHVTDPKMGPVKSNVEVSIQWYC